MRPTNPELVAQFRDLLTNGFYGVSPDGEVLDGRHHATVLAATKPWRGDLWKAFREIENRLDPAAALRE